MNPTIEVLEAELTGPEADKMSEVVLRSKLKYVNSLKWFFKRVFETL